jgi:hypothetical protein
MGHRAPRVKPRLQVLQELFELPERAGHKAVPAPWSNVAGADEPGGAQNPQVLGDRGLGEWQLVHEMAAHTGVAGRQEPDDTDARRMSQRLGERGQSGVRRRVVGPELRRSAQVRRTAGRLDDAVGALNRQSTIDDTRPGSSAQGGIAGRPAGRGHHAGGRRESVHGSVNRGSRSSESSVSDSRNAMRSARCWGTSQKPRTPSLLLGLSCPMPR